MIPQGKQRPVICRLPKAAVPQLAEIELETGNSPAWTEKLFNDEFSHDYSRIYGARMHGNLVGFLAGHIILDEGHILNFGLRASYRGQGIGKALLVYVLREFHAAGTSWVGLEVRVSNTIAKALYNSVGFTEVAIRHQYYADTMEDALILRLEMTDFINRFGATED